MDGWEARMDGWEAREKECKEGVKKKEARMRGREREEGKVYIRALVILRVLLKYKKING